MENPQMWFFLTPAQLTCREACFLERKEPQMHAPNACNPSLQMLRGNLGARTQESCSQAVWAKKNMNQAQ